MAARSLESCKQERIEWFFKERRMQMASNNILVVGADRKRVGSIAQGSFEAAKAVVRAWLIEENVEAAEVDLLFDELWAVLHGMAALYLDRSAAFDLREGQHCVAKLLMGTRLQPQRLRRIEQNAACSIYEGSKRLKAVEKQ